MNDEQTPDQPQQPQPGQQFTPGQASPTPAQPVETPSQPVAEQPAAAPVPAEAEPTTTVTPETPSASTQTTTEPIAPAPTQPDPIQSAPNTPTQPLQHSPVNDDELIWQASEYVHHEKDAMWFGIFITVTVIALGLLYLLLQDVLSIIVIALMAISVLVFANRKPRTLHYGISDEGVMIDQKYYSYDSFRSFSLMQDGGMPNIMLDPLQRFMPPITIYFAPEQGEQIIDVLSNYLPHQDKEPDFVDKFARRIRF